MCDVSATYSWRLHDKLSKIILWGYNKSAKQFESRSGPTYISGLVLVLSVYKGYRCKLICLYASAAC